MFKIHSAGKKLEDFRSGFINLGILYFMLSEPLKFLMKKGLNEMKISVWDKEIIEEDLKLQELIDHLERNIKLSFQC
jgi:hypothetical protein